MILVETEPTVLYIFFEENGWNMNLNLEGTFANSENV